MPARPHLTPRTLTEPGRQTPIFGHFDGVILGGGCNAHALHPMPASS